MSDQPRPVWLTEDEIHGHGLGIVEIAKLVRERWDAAPADAWHEIADEYRSHRCKDGNCFAETMLMRLGAIPSGNPASPFGI